MCARNKKCRDAMVATRLVKLPCAQRKMSSPCHAKLASSPLRFLQDALENKSRDQSMA